MKKTLVRWAMTTMPRWLGRRMTGRFLPIFMLHRCLDDEGNPDPQQIEGIRRNLEYFRRQGYRAISLQQLLVDMSQGEPLPDRTAVFTVDDGFHDQAEILGPMFAKFDIPLTFFVITDFLEQRLWSWDDHLRYIIDNSPLDKIELTLPDDREFTIHVRQQHAYRPVREALKQARQEGIYEWLDHFYAAGQVERPQDIPQRYRPMSWEQARKLIDMGHAIAPHTRSHRILSQLEDATAEQEILGSWEDLKQRLPGCSPVFAYPTGRAKDFTTRDMRTVAESELLGAVSTEPGVVRLHNDRQALPRYGMPHDLTNFMQYLDYIEVIKNRIRGASN